MSPKKKPGLYSIADAKSSPTRPLQTAMPLRGYPSLAGLLEQAEWRVWLRRAVGASLGPAALAMAVSGCDVSESPGEGIEPLGSAPVPIRSTSSIGAIEMFAVAPSEPEPDLEVPSDEPSEPPCHTSESVFDEPPEYSSHIKPPPVQHRPVTARGVMRPVDLAGGVSPIDFEGL